MSHNTHEIETQFKVSGVQEVVTANEQIVKELQQLRNAGVQGGEEVQRLSDALRRNMEATYALRRGYSAMRLESRTAHMALIEFGYTLNSVAGIGRDLNSIFGTYNTAQIRIAETQTQLTEANKDVAYWTDLHNQYLNDFGADSDYATKAVKQLNDALTAQSQAQKSVVQAQSDMNAQYVAWALMAPGIVNNLIQIGIKAKDASVAIAAKGGLAATLASSTVGVTAEAAALAMGGEAFGLAGAAAAAPATVVTLGAIGAGYGYGKQREQLNQAAELQGYMQQLASGQNVAAPTWASQPQLQQAADIYCQSLLDTAEKRLSGSNIATPTGIMHVAGQQTITINQYNQISSMTQAKEAADSIYQDLVDKISQQSLGK